MATRRTVGRVGALLGAAVVLLIWGAAPAWAAPSLTVDPSTDLVDGQVVDVSGTGYSAGTFVGVIMCEPSPASLSDCDLSPLATANTDASGGFSTTFPVRRFIQTDDGTTDCAAAPGACVLFAGTPDFTQGATAPLSFDPDAPAVPPLEMTATISDRATIDRRSGAAFLTGTVTCNREAFFTVDGALVQSSGTRLVRAFSFAPGVCDPGGTDVLLTFEPSGAGYAGGDAVFQGSTFAQSTDGEFLSQDVSTGVHVVHSK